MEPIENYIRAVFASSVGLKQEEIFSEDLTLAQIMARSDRLHNSIDLMEAFARTANGLKKEHGVKVRLPAFPLDTPISAVLASFLAEAEKVAA